MNTRPLVQADMVPRLAAHMRLRFDKTRETWTIQAPERAFILDVIAHAIVSRCDGAATVSAIIDDLSRAYSGSPREMIEKDVGALIQDFVDKGVLLL